VLSVCSADADSSCLSSRSCCRKLAAAFVDTCEAAEVVGKHLQTTCGKSTSLTCRSQCNCIQTSICFTTFSVHLLYAAVRSDTELSSSRMPIVLVGPIISASWLLATETWDEIAIYKTIVDSDTFVDF